MKTTYKSEIEHAMNCFIQRFGSDSEYQAAIRARELDTTGDREGAALWRMVEFELRVHNEAKRHLH